MDLPDELPSYLRTIADRKPFVDAIEAAPGEEEVISSVWSAWGNGDETTFVSGLRRPTGDTPGLQLLKVFEAASKNDAMRRYYEWLGWEPYKPMTDADGNEYPEDNAPFAAKDQS